VGALRTGVRLARVESQRVPELRQPLPDGPGRARSVLAQVGQHQALRLGQPGLRIGHTVGGEHLPVRRRSGSTRARVAVACIRRTTGGVATQSVRRIAWWRTSVRSS
jgi:hypothetical protein